MKKTIFHRLFESQKTLCLMPACDYCDQDYYSGSGPISQPQQQYTVNNDATTNTTTTPTTTTTTTPPDGATTTSGGGDTTQTPATVNSLVGQILQSGSGIGGAIGGLFQSPLYLFTPQPNVVNNSGGLSMNKNVILLLLLAVGGYFAYKHFVK